MNKNRGFTLIELMVVILILAILAALIVPKVVGRASDAKIAKATSDVAEIHGLLEQFRLDTDRYPTTQEGLQALETAPPNIKNWKGPYSSKPIPKDPWGNDYYYEYPGAGGKETFTLMSYGKDGVAGGDAGTEDADIIDGQ